MRHATLFSLIITAREKRQIRNNVLTNYNFSTPHKALREKENKVRIKNIIDIVWWISTRHSAYAVTSQWKRRSWLPYKLRPQQLPSWLNLAFDQYLRALPFAKYDHHHHHHLSSYTHTHISKLNLSIFAVSDFCRCIYLRL